MQHGFLFSVTMPELKVKSKCDFVTFIEDLFSEYEIKEGDNKVINLEELPQEVEMSDLEKSLTKGVNCLFNEILELKKSVKLLQARDIGSERKEEEGRVSGGGEQTRREDGVMRTMDNLGSKPWVTPSNAGNIKETNKLRDEMQKMESQLDEIGQRGLKGMVVCSAPDFKYVEGRKVKIPSLFEEMKTLKPEEGEIATKEEELEDLNKVLCLIEKKYGVKVPITEVYGCHFIPNGMYCIRFVYRNPACSAWADLMKEIRTGGKEDTKFYCNIQLTRKRRLLFNAVRELKFNRRIQQYRIDVNGCISLKLKDRWMKLTQYYTNAGELIPTKLPKDLDRIIAGY